MNVVSRPPALPPDGFEPGETVATRLGPIVVKYVLGRGGFGVVWYAEHTEKGPYVIKTTLRERMNGPQKDREKTIERFIREARTLGSIRHPNVVATHDYIVDDRGRILLVMEYLPGRTLDQLLDVTPGNKLPIPIVLRIGAETCAGLSAIHDHCVHRDVKPSNIAVGDWGERITIFDLGIGKSLKESGLTSKNQIIGTKNFMSPEQVMEPETVDARSDLFSLGTVLFTAATGKHPFPISPHEHGAYQCIRIANHAHPNVARALVEAHPDLSDHQRRVAEGMVATLIDKLLSKKAGERPPSAKILGRVFQEILKVWFAEAPQEPLYKWVQALPPARATAESIAPSQPPEPTVTASLNPDALSTTNVDAAAAVQFASTDETPPAAPSAEPKPPPSPPRETPVHVATKEWDRDAEVVEALVRIAERNDREARKALLDALKSASIPLARVVAAEFLGRTGDEQALAALRARFDVELEPMVRAQILTSIEAIEERLGHRPAAAADPPAPKPEEQKPDRSEELRVAMEALRSSLLKTAPSTWEASFEKSVLDSNAVVRAAAALILVDLHPVKFAGMQFLEAVRKDEQDAWAREKMELAMGLLRAEIMAGEAGEVRAPPDPAPPPPTESPASSPPPISNENGEAPRGIENSSAYRETVRTPPAKRRAQQEVMMAELRARIDRTERPKRDEVERFLWHPADSARAAGIIVTAELWPDDHQALALIKFCIDREPVIWVRRVLGGVLHALRSDRNESQGPEFLSELREALPPSPEARLKLLRRSLVARSQSTRAAAAALLLEVEVGEDLRAELAEHIESEPAEWVAAAMGRVLGELESRAAPAPLPPAAVPTPSPDASIAAGERPRAMDGSVAYKARAPAVVAPSKPPATEGTSRAAGDQAYRLRREDLRRVLKPLDTDERSKVLARTLESDSELDRSVAAALIKELGPDAAALGPPVRQERTPDPTLVSPPRGGLRALAILGALLLVLVVVLVIAWARG